MSQRRREFIRRAALGVAAATVSGVSAPAQGTRTPAARPARDAAGDASDVVTPYFGRKPLATGQKGMVITSSPHATRAAVELLRRGANACDAALCASVVQTVTEPHMTTITGVLSMLYYDAATRKSTYLNGGMNAPLAPLTGFSGADIATGRGAGVPGFWAGFEAALARHGTRPKAEIVKPAIDYARNGFPIYPFLYAEMFVQLDTIGKYPTGRRLYMPNGALLPPGAVLKQPEAADTLERLVAEGNQYFYHGEFARAFSKTVQDAGGVITPRDFERYEVRWQDPARGTYRGYEVVASPIPDNGGTHIIEALNMLELLDLQRMGPPNESGDTLSWMVRISNDVMSEGAKHTDPTSHDVPLDFITSKEYAQMRLKLLRMAPIKDGIPAPSPGSNHVTVIDGKGNAATILHSVMALPWSSGLFVHGVSVAGSGGHFLRVMPRPGDRATTYVAPNMILKDGRPVLPSGSPSVGLIPNILQNTVNILDFGVPIEQSVLRPRFGAPSLTPSRPGNYIEADFDEKVRNAAASKGVRFSVVSPWHFMNGSFEGIHVDANTGMMRAAADPRRSGMAEAV